MQARNDYPVPSLNDYYVSASYLKACNLYCRTCRNERILADVEPIKIAIHNAFLGELGNINGILHSSGELLFSKMGRELLGNNPNNKISFNTNGMLLNKKNWDYLLNLYNDISVAFSIDGASKKTFEYLRRGANFETVMKNLHLAGKLRLAGRINALVISCAVQVGNFTELEEIVQIGKDV
jgi:molybdenum cofactor biosynthesis enzyme MoaA